MASDMKASSRTIEDMAKANSSGQMAGFMKVAGKQESNMETVFLSAKRVRKSMVSGKTERGSNGSTNKQLLPYVSY